MKQAVPVFFIHSGNQDYLRSTVTQAEKAKNRVYLLGDESNRHIASHWVDMSEYTSDQWIAFQKVYTHMSSNPYEFELNCFRRFFVAYEFAKAEKIHAFMMLDSDCFAFADFSELNFDAWDAGLSMPKEQDDYVWTASPHGSYWTLPALKDFLEYLIYTYEQDRTCLEEKWAYHRKNNVQGGICDMTLLYLWATADRGFRILNTALGLEDGVFDHFLSVTEGYSKGTFPIRRFCQMKHIRFRNGQAYFKRKDGRWVRSYTVHAQGKSKIYIPVLAKQASCPLRYAMAKMTNLGLRALKKWRVLIP